MRWGVRDATGSSIPGTLRPCREDNADVLIATTIFVAVEKPSCSRGRTKTSVPRRFSKIPWAGSVSENIPGGLHPRRVILAAGMRQKDRGKRYYRTEKSVGPFVCGLRYFCVCSVRKTTIYRPNPPTGNARVSHTGFIRKTFSAEIRLHAKITRSMKSSVRKIRVNGPRVMFDRNALTLFDDGTPSVV